MSNEQEMDLDHESGSMGSDADKLQVESLVAGRAKRATAGNRLSTLLRGEEQEREEADELGLLFAEDEEEEDVDFQEEEDNASDVQLDSSSDDEDQGPTAGAEDLEGEKEIQKQDKEERKKKRKAHAMFRGSAGLRKGVKVDPTTMKVTPTTPAPRPKKKSERTSFLPTLEDGPVRASLRKQTMRNKEIVHQRLQEDERRRVKQMKTLEAAAKKREALKPKALTQADRLEEAARVEKRNAKSLNRWEESEKKKAEEEKARLAALQNRQMNGPYVTWWSGPSKWVDGKLVATGVKRLDDRVGEKRKSMEKLEDVPDQNHAQTITHSEDILMTEDRAVTQSEDGHTETNNTVATVPQVDLSPPQPAPAMESQLPIQTSGTEASPFYNSFPQLVPIHSVPEDQLISSAQVSLPAPEPAPEPTIEITARNLVILNTGEEDDDGVTLNRSNQLQNHILVKKKAVKLQKVAPDTCAITGHVARYRDPRTGLAYANSYSYKEIQKLKDGGSRWSSLLGCYVGPAKGAARGVPEGFLKS